MNAAPDFSIFSFLSYFLTILSTEPINTLSHPPSIISLSVKSQTVV